ncbi:MAG: UDP-N-acetylglucosamine 2-epimerase (non-hydrolyzing) [Bacteroidetes bacterium]|nr:UDP-N-acetylglucosamine 2-epimerase (non-hydrolyzing) [Bacteroidota bacterium]
MKIVTIIGARPQIIKAAAISRAIRNSFSKKIKEVIVHTGQHYDHKMSAIFFDELQIPKEDYNLNTGSASHAVQTAEIMRLLEPVLEGEQPNAVLVYGDTNSTLAAALTAAKMHIPVVHVEAGMRSFNKTMPEEVNRICCDHVSTMLFSPTITGAENLYREGFKSNAKPPYSINNPLVVHCGDVMYDNSIYFATEAKNKSTVLNDSNVEAGEFILCTIHRDSNTDDAINLNSIFNALNQIADKSNQKIILPLHPRTAKVLSQRLQPELYSKVQSNANLQIIEPVSFLDMIALESDCNMIITDSGGVQKESYFFRKPCVILRNETEWVELVAQGTAIMAGPDTEKIVSAYNHLKAEKLNFPPVFGDGHAAEFICERIYSGLN